VTIAPGEKVFGALQAIAGAAIILTGHWATMDDVIADLIAGLLMLGFGAMILLIGAFSANYLWSVEAMDVCFIVRDANGQALAYAYFEEEPGRRSAAHLLTRDEARRIPEIARPPELVEAALGAHAD
jgi:hypothetical protein